MSAGESGQGPSSPDPASTLNGFNVVLLLEALALVDSARVAAETVLEANCQEIVAA